MVLSYSYVNSVFLNNFPHSVRHAAVTFDNTGADTNSGTLGAVGNDNADALNFYRGGSVGGQGNIDSAIHQ